MSLAALRLQLAAVVAGTPSSTPGLPTGLAALDAVLPGGGLPPGRITELLAAPGLGKTTVARALVTTTIASGRCVAWIDATRTLDPRNWDGRRQTADGRPQKTDDGRQTADGRTTSNQSPAATHSQIADSDALWVVRPTDSTRAPWCADLLLRTGAFALVVLDGAPVLPRVVAVRLAQLAREADAVLLLLGDGTKAAELGSALRLVMRRRGTVTLEKGGPYQHVPLQDLENSSGKTSGTHGVARRLCAYPEIPDRRGVARSRQRRRPANR